MMRIPKTVCLPWYKIAVRFKTQEEMDADLKQGGELGADGYWDKDTRTIWIVSDALTLPQQRYVLAHELGHAWLDWMDEFVDTWTITERSRLTHPQGPSAVAQSSKSP